jgi:hypothetical protein
MGFKVSSAKLRDVVDAGDHGEVLPHARYGSLAGRQPVCGFRVVRCAVHPRLADLEAASCLAGIGFKDQLRVSLGRIHEGDDDVVVLAVRNGAGRAVHLVLHHGAGGAHSRCVLREAVDGSLRRLNLLLSLSVSIYPVRVSRCPPTGVKDILFLS